MTTPQAARNTPKPLLLPSKNRKKHLARPFLRFPKMLLLEYNSEHAGHLQKNWQPSKYRGTPPKLPLFAPKIRKIGKKSNSSVFDIAKNFIVRMLYTGHRLRTNN